MTRERLRERNGRRSIVQVDAAGLASQHAIKTHEDDGATNGLRRRLTENFSGQSERAKIVSEEELSFKTALPKYIISAESEFKSRWDWFIITLVVYNSALIPWSMAFDTSEPAGLKALDYVIDIFFLGDIILNFRHAHIDKHGIEVVDPVLVRKNYIEAWFLVDFLGFFPFEIILIILNINLRPGVFNLFKIPRLLRLGRLMKKLDQISGANALRIIKLLFGFALFAHWIACIWFYLGRFQGEGNRWTGAVWLVENNLCQTVKGPDAPPDEVGTVYERDGYPACIYKDIDAAGAEDWYVKDFTVVTGTDGSSVLVTPEPTKGTVYVASFYFALTTLTTVGYGDITPGTNTERSFAIFVMLIGAIVYASIFGNVAVLIQSFDQMNALYKERVDKLKAFAQFHDITPATYEKMVVYMDKAYFQTQGFDVDDILVDFPTNFRGEVLMEMHSEFVKMLRSASPYLARPEMALFLRSLISRLKPLVVLEGDNIVRIGEVGHEMYFIRRGIVEVVSDPREDTNRNKFLTRIRNGIKQWEIRAKQPKNSSPTGGRAEAPASPMEDEAGDNDGGTEMHDCLDTHILTLVKDGGDAEQLDVEEIADALQKPVLLRLGPGEHFGEVTLFTEGRRQNNVYAKTFCELYRLDGQNFRELEMDYTEEVDCMKKFAVARMEAKARRFAVSNDPAFAEPTDEDVQREVDSMEESWKSRKRKSVYEPDRGLAPAAETGAITSVADAAMLLLSQQAGAASDGAASDGAAAAPLDDAAIERAVAPLRERIAQLESRLASGIADAKKEVGESKDAVLFKLDTLLSFYEPDRLSPVTLEM